MRKNKNHTRRTFLTVGIILAVAIMGLFMVNVGSASADRSSLAALTGSQTPANTEIETPVQTQNESDVSMLSAVIKMVSALVIVVLAVYAGLYMLRKLMGKKYGNNGRNGILDVIQTTFVGPHKAISLVRVANRSVLVGVTENQISTLTELNEAETADILADVDSRPQPADRFAGLLKSAGDKLREVSAKKRPATLET